MQPRPEATRRDSSNSSCFGGANLWEEQDETSSSVHLVLANLGLKEGWSNRSRGAGIGCRIGFTMGAVPQLDTAIWEYKFTSQHTPQFHASFLACFPVSSAQNALPPFLPTSNHNSSSYLILQGGLLLQGAFPEAPTVLSATLCAWRYVYHCLFTCLSRCLSTRLAAL